MDGRITSCHVDRRIRNGVVDAALYRGDVQERHRAVGLGVEIDEERLLAAQREPGGEIDGGRGLAYSTLLIGNGNNHDVTRVILGVAYHESKD